MSYPNSKQVHMDESKDREEEHLSAVSSRKDVVGTMPSLKAQAELLKSGDIADLELAAALAESHIDPWSRRSFKLYGCLLVAFMAAIQNRFDGSIMSNINAMHQYLNFFGYAQSGKSAGFVFISYNIGNIISATITGAICDWKGRKFGLLCYAVTIVFAAAMSAASQNRAWFIGTRIVLGMGIGFATSVAPVYAVEMAPPQWRGRCGGAYNSCYFVGQILVSGIMVGTTHLPNTGAWRIPLGLQAIPAVVVLATVYFIPESPRWLIAKGRHEEAEIIFAELHGGGDRQNALVQLQMREIMELAEFNNAARQLRWWDFSQLFNSHEVRWRTLMVTLMSLFGQWTGNGIGYFLPVMYAGAGISSQTMQLTMSFINSLTSFLGAGIGTSVTDRWGRRPRLIYGTLWITLTMLAAFALTYEFGKGGPKFVVGETNPGARAGVFFLFLYGFSFAVVYTPLQSLYCAENLSNGIRAKGMAYHTIIVNIAGFVSTFGISVALQKIGNYVYLVYVGWCFIETVVWFFFCVETRGRTMEELDHIYNSPNPVRESKKKTIITSNGEVL